LGKDLVKFLGLLEIFGFRKKKPKKLRESRKKTRRKNSMKVHIRSCTETTKVMSMTHPRNLVLYKITHSSMIM